MTGQRVVAVVLTFLLFALIIVGSVAIARVCFGYPAWGWFIGFGICALMVVGFICARAAPAHPEDHRTRRR